MTKNTKRIVISIFLTILFYIPLFFIFNDVSKQKNKINDIRLSLYHQKSNLKNSVNQNKTNQKKEIKNIHETQTQAEIELPKEENKSEKNTVHKNDEYPSQIEKTSDDNNSKKSMSDPIIIIQKLINENLVYPEIAKKRKMSGCVVYHIRTDSNFNLKECTLIQSSGFKTLDNSASELIKSIFPVKILTNSEFPPIDEKICIEYRLK